MAIVKIGDGVSFFRGGGMEALTGFVYAVDEDVIQVMVCFPDEPRLVSNIPHKDKPNRSLDGEYWDLPPQKSG